MIYRLMSIIKNSTIEEMRNISESFLKYPGNIPAFPSKRHGTFYMGRAMKPGTDSHLGIIGDSLRSEITRKIPEDSSEV